MGFHLKDRFEAGRLLAARLTAYQDRPDVLVLALPRGGVPVAYEIAKRIHAPLDVFIVRKLGTPWNEELAMGAIATGGIRVLNEGVVHSMEISEEEIAVAEAKEKKELARREHDYRDNRPAPKVRGKPSSWWTMALLPARPCGQPSRLYGNNRLPASFLPPPLCRSTPIQN